MELDPIMQALVGQKQQQSVAMATEERKLVAEEGEVRQAVGQAKADLAVQRKVGAQYAGAVDILDQQASEALQASLKASEEQAKLDLSVFQAAEEKKRTQDQVAAQLKGAFGMDALVTQIGPNIQAMQGQIDNYQDKLSNAKQEIIDTSNPIKWVWKNLVEVPYYEKKVQANQQQLLNTLGVAGKTFLTANNAQVIADQFTTKATPETVVANVYNTRAAALAAEKESMESNAATERVRNFGIKYGIQKDVTDQMQQLTQIIASTYNANKSTSLRASGAKGMEDILDVYKKYAELADTLKASPGQMQQLAQNGIDFDRAMSAGATARGMYLNHAASDLPFVPSGSYENEGKIPELLVAGKKATQFLPSPMNQFIASTIFEEAEKEYLGLKTTMSSGGDAAKFLETSRFVLGERDTLVKGSVKRINGLDLTKAFDQEYVFKYGVDDGVPRTPGQFLTETVLLAPGSPVGKELLSSQAIENLIASGRKGSNLAKLYRAYADGKTPEGLPVLPANGKLDFDMIRGMANNDPAEIYAFYNAAYNLAQLSLPYTAVGAKPSNFQAGIPGNFATMGTFGPDKKDWVGIPRSEEDVKKWMLQADLAKKLLISEQERRLQERALSDPLNPAAKFGK